MAIRNEGTTPYLYQFLKVKKSVQYTQDFAIVFLLYTTPATGKLYLKMNNAVVNESHSGFQK